jgi:hypothetical protein
MSIVIVSIVSWLIWESKREEGHAIGQTVGRRLPTSAARVLARVRSYGIYGGQSGTEAGFLRVLRFPHRLFHAHHPGLVQYAS